MPSIPRILARTSSALLACGLVGQIAFTGAPADASALPRPRAEEWWFVFWDIQNRVWHQTTGQGVTVAVIDTGVNADLPELRGVVLPGGDARNGVSGDGRTDVDRKPEGHGTEMAALIAAQGGRTRFAGVAPGAKILPVVADGTLPSLVKGIRFAADHGAKVINVSSGYPYPGGCPDAVETEISRAIDKGAVVVAAAGNEGDTTNFSELPGACPGVLTVGAITNQRLAWTRTQRQSYVSVAAPGVEVGSVTKTGTFNNTISGTSQASALAAGAVALLRSAQPRLSPRQVVQKIINTTVEAGPPGRDNMTGSGAMVPIFSLTKDVAPSAPNQTFERLDQWRAANAPVTPTHTPTSSTSDEHTKSSSARTTVTAVVTLVILGLFATLVTFIVRGQRRPRGQAPFTPGDPPHATGQDDGGPSGSRRGPPGGRAPDPPAGT